MKLGLKNVKFYESMSEETNCFQADLFINGKKIAYVKNSGQGGCTDYHVLDFTQQQILRDAEAYCLTLPKQKISDTFEFQPTLESMIDDLFELWLKAKQDTKLAKRINTSMLNCIICGSPQNYTEYFWQTKDKKKVPIAQMLKTENGRNLIIAKLKSLKGQNILNTNLPADLLNLK